MDKLPDNINIFTDGVGDFSNANVIFENRNGSFMFQIVTDDEWYLCSDGKFREDPRQAALYEKDAIKDGKLVKSYSSITHRALEAIAFVMAGRFPKVD